MIKKVLLFLLIILTFSLIACDADVENTEADKEEDTTTLDLISELEKLEKEQNDDPMPISEEEIEENEVEAEVGEEEEIEPVEDGEVLEEEENGENEEVINIEDSNKDTPKIIIDETELAEIKINVNDPDNDTITFTFTKPLSNDGTWQTNYGDAGEYLITATATDGKFNVAKDFLLVVNKKNVAPEIIGLQSRIDAKEGDIVKLEFNVTDLNKDDIELTFPVLFDSEGVWETDFKSAGDYELELIASDGETETLQKFKLVVANVNQPPILTLNNAEDEVVIKEGDLFELDLEVEDLDGDKVTYEVSAPLDSLSWQTQYTDHGEYLIVISATDGQDVVEQEFTLKVIDVNLPPEIIDVVQG